MACVWPRAIFNRPRKLWQILLCSLLKTLPAPARLQDQCKLCVKVFAICSGQGFFNYDLNKSLVTLFYDMLHSHYSFIHYNADSENYITSARHLLSFLYFLSFWELDPASHQQGESADKWPHVCTSNKPHSLLRIKRIWLLLHFYLPNLMQYVSYDPFRTIQGREFWET